MNDFENKGIKDEITLPEQVLISMDPGLVARAESHIKKYPGDKDVAVAYKAYREAERITVDNETSIANNLITTLDAMEKHYALKAHVDVFVQKASPIVASLIKSAERFESLKIKMENLKVQKELPGSSGAIPRAIVELGERADREANRYADLKGKYDDLYSDVGKVDGMYDDEQLLGVINGVSAKIPPLDRQPEYTDSELVRPYGEDTTPSDQPKDDSDKPIS